MNKTATLASIVLLAAMLGACSRGSNDYTSTSAFRHLNIADNGDVIVHARNGTNARITSAGDLTIAGKPVAIDSGQRQLLVGYRTDAVALRKDAIATGKAGAKLGLNALGTVAKGLASGAPDSIDKQLQPQADKVSGLGQKVCRDLAALHAAQGKLAAAIPAFTPYATIEPHDVSECRAG
jgi:hypothetical protein